MEGKMKDEMRDSERVMEMFQVTFLFVLQIYSGILEHRAELWGIKSEETMN